MNRLLLALGAVIALAGVWFVFVRAGERGPVRASLSPEELAALPERVVAELDLAPTGQRNAIPASEAERPPTPTRMEEPRAPEARAVLVRGRVLDAVGEALAGVPIVRTGGWLGLPGKTEIAVSGAGGHFEAELTPGGEDGELQCKRDSRFLTVRAARLSRLDVAREHILVAAPALELGGTVVAAGGAPLRSASVRFGVPIEAFAGFPVPLDGTVAVPLETETGADGRFAGLRVPAMAGAELTASRDGFRSQVLAAPGETRNDLWIELEPLAPGEPWLRGVVVHADGTPAEDALVRLDSLATKSADDGSFELEKGEWADPEAPLVAALRGFQPALLPRAGELLQQEFAPAPVRLVLGGPTLAIAGRVLDAHGEPCRGWRVGLLDGTVVTPSRVPFDVAEDLARGKKVETRSDAHGAFELEGLLARAYVVRAWDEDTLLMLHSEPIPAGTRELVLRVPEDALHARLAGRVVGRDGRPVAGARVSARVVTAENRGAISFHNGAGANTDENGRFELANVPRRHAALDVDGELVMPTVLELDDAAEGQELQVEVARRCHLRVELASEAADGAGAGPPDALSALDADGNALALYTFQGNGWSAGTRLRLSGLGTHPLGVSEDARTLVLYRENVELSRVAVELVPGELSVVRAGGTR